MVDPSQAAELPGIVSGAATGTTLVLATGTYDIPSTLQFAKAGVTLRSASDHAEDVVIDGQYAVNEGIASYYAAAIWNRTDESDCYYTPSYALDWTQDGVGDSSAEFSCESGVYAGVDSYDYMGDYCLAVGAVTNRGTQYDWMRFFWDLETDQGLSVTDIFAIWDEADPDAWTASGAGSGASFPAYELDAAASALGYGAEWSTQLALDPSAGR